MQEPDVVFLASRAYRTDSRGQRLSCFDCAVNDGEIERTGRCDRLIRRVVGELLVRRVNADSCVVARVAHVSLRRVTAKLVEARVVETIRVPVAKTGERFVANGERN